MSSGGFNFFNSGLYTFRNPRPQSINSDTPPAIIAHRESSDRPEGERIGRISRYDAAAADYAEHLKKTMGCDLTGLVIAMDCANGAASAIAPGLFRDLGAQVLPLGVTPDGVNINENCGSTHLGGLSHLVRDQACSLGLAFDGDADRMLAVDEYGDPVDGDIIMAIIADDMRTQGALPADTLVVTVMSNMGLDIAARERGIRLEKTKVGDRYVLESMIAGGFDIGGEQSGHIILSEYATTGDGMLSALRLLRALQSRKQTLGEARKIIDGVAAGLESARAPMKQRSRDGRP